MAKVGGEGMQFFGIGTAELLLIFVVVLIIWGPDKIVEVARTLGKMFRTLKKASFDLTAKVTKELDEQEPSPPRQRGK
jgi:sec-independent protein translocase protein TatA